MVHMCLIEFHAAIFAWPGVISDSISQSRQYPLDSISHWTVSSGDSISPGEEWDAVT